MIHTALAAGQVVTAHIVGNEHILDILAHIAALDVIIFKVGHGHYHHISLHFHHHSDQLFLTDVIGLDLGLGLCQLKNGIVRVAGDIVNGQVRAAQKLFNDAFEILVKAGVF